MLTATLRWRDQFKVTEAIKEEFPDEVFGKLGYVYGKDKSGRPVTCLCSHFMGLGCGREIDVDDVWLCIGIICTGRIRI